MAQQTMTPLTRRALVRGAAGLAALSAAGARAQGAAQKPPAGQPLDGGPLHLVVPYPAGGSTDRAARLLADAIGPALGVPVLVENRAGAGGRLAAQQVHREPAGRNVLLLANPAPMLVAPLVQKEDGYNPQTDYRPVSEITRYAFGIAVGPAVPVQAFGPLRGWMQANPEKVSVGVPATGSLPHFFALMLAGQLKLDLPVVGYKGSAPLLNDLMGGHVPVAVDTLDALEPLHRAGKLRILATSDERRSASLPQVPTFKESGLTLSASGWNALFAPASLPAPRLQRIAAAVERAMADPAVRKRFADADLVPVGSGPAQTARMLDAYRAQWTPVIRDSGFKP